MLPSRLPGFVVALAVAGLLLAVAILLGPEFLFFFDSANFAFALEEFNPAKHQPQPPGYPLFVGLSRFYRATGAEARWALILAGITCASAAAGALRSLGSSAFQSGVGGTAALLLAVHPVLWFSLLTNQVRLALAAIGCVLALLAWRSWTRAGERRWLLLFGAAYGLGAGFRPETLLLCLPLFLMTLWKRRSDLALCTCALLLAGFCVASWALPTAAASGGLRSYRQLLSDYSADQFSASSALFGAGFDASLRMAAQGLVWNLVPALAWGWSLPVLLRRRSAGPVSADLLLLMGLWLVPALLFQTIFHAADPDHVLITAPAWCLLGGYALTNSFHRPPPRTAAVILAAAASVYLFFHPPGGPSRAFGYGVIRYVGDHARSNLGTLQRLDAQGSLRAILWHGAVTPWRTIAFYFPHVPVLPLPPGQPAKVALVRGREAGPAPQKRGMYLIPQGEVAIVGPLNETEKRSLEQAGGRQAGAVAVLSARPGASIVLNGIRFGVPLQER